MPKPQGFVNAAAEEVSVVFSRPGGAKKILQQLLIISMDSLTGSRPLFHQGCEKL